MNSTNNSAVTSKPDCIPMISDYNKETAFYFSSEEYKNHIISFIPYVDDKEIFYNYRVLFVDDEVIVHDKCGELYQVFSDFERGNNREAQFYLQDASDSIIHEEYFPVDDSTDSDVEEDDWGNPLISEIEMDFDRLSISIDNELQHEVRPRNFVFERINPIVQIPVRFQSDTSVIDVQLEEILNTSLVENLTVHEQATSYSTFEHDAEEVQSIQSDEIVVSTSSVSSFNLNINQKHDNNRFDSPDIILSKSMLVKLYIDESRFYYVNKGITYFHNDVYYDYTADSFVIANREGTVYSLVRRLIYENLSYRQFALDKFVLSKMKANFQSGSWSIPFSHTVNLSPELTRIMENINDVIDDIEFKNIIPDSSTIVDNSTEIVGSILTRISSLPIVQRLCDNFTEVTLYVVFTAALLNYVSSGSNVSISVAIVTGAVIIFKKRSVLNDIISSIFQFINGTPSSSDSVIPQMAGIMYESDVDISIQYLSTLLVSLFGVKEYINKGSMMETLKNVSHLYRAKTALADHVKVIIEFVAYIIKSVREFLGEKDCVFRILSPDNPDIEEFIDNTEKILTKAHNRSLIPTHENIELLRVTLLKGNRLLHNTSPYVRKSEQLIRRYLNQLDKIFAHLLDKNPSSDHIRPEPVSIFLLGGPACGKSGALSAMSYELGAHLVSDEDLEDFKRMKSDFIYSRYHEQEFMDGVTIKHIIYLFDDFNQTRDVPGQPTELMDIIRIVNIFFYRFHMADISDKGQVYCNAKVVIGTSNKCRFTAESLYSTEALTRRMQLVYIVCPKDEYCTPESLHNHPMERRFKPELLPDGKRAPTRLDALMCDYHEYNVYTHEFGNVVGYDDIIEKVLERVKISEQRHLDALDFINDRINPIIEKRIKARPQMYMEFGIFLANYYGGMLVGTIFDMWLQSRQMQHRIRRCDWFHNFEENITRLPSDVTTMLRNRYRLARNAILIAAQVDEIMITEEEIFNILRQYDYIADIDTPSRMSQFLQSEFSFNVDDVHANMLQNFTRENNHTLNTIFDMTELENGFSLMKDFRKVATAAYLETNKKIVSFAAWLWDNNVFHATFTYLTLVKVVGSSSILYDTIFSQLISYVKGKSKVQIMIDTMIELPRNKMSLEDLLYVLVTCLNQEPKSLPVDYIFNEIVKKNKVVLPQNADLSDWVPSQQQLLKMIQNLDAGLDLYHGFLDSPSYTHIFTEEGEEMITPQSVTKGFNKDQTRQQRINRAYNRAKHQGNIPGKNIASLLKQDEPVAQPQGEWSTDTLLPVISSTEAVVPQISIVRDTNNIDELSSAAIHNMWTLEHTEITNKELYRKSGNFLFIGRYLAVMPRHFITLIEVRKKACEDKGWGHLFDDFKFRMIPNKITHGGGSRFIDFETLKSCIIVDRPESDLIFLWLDKLNIHSQGDISHKFLPRDYLKRHEVYSITMMKMSDGMREAIPATACRYKDLEVEFEFNNQKTTYVVAETLEYNAMTMDGDCGALVGLNSCGSRRKFLGMHIAGKSGVMNKGYCSFIYQEDLTDIINKLKQEKKWFVDKKSDAAVVPQSSVYCDRFADLYFEYPLSTVSLDTSICYSGLSAWPMTKGISPKAPFVNEESELINPLELVMRKYCINNHIFVNPKIVTAIFDNIFDMLNSQGNYHPYHKPLMTMNMATFGDPDRPGWRALTRSTSAGYPLNKMSKGKSMYMGPPDKPFTELPSNIVNHLESIILMLKRGERPIFLVTDNLKDELVSLEKIKQGKVRLFNGTSLDYQIIFRMYFGEFIYFLTQNMMHNECAVGMDPYSMDWHFLAEYLGRYGFSKCFGDGDYSGFDASEISQIHWAMLDIINRWYSDVEENQYVRKLLWLELTQSRHIIDNLVYEWGGSLPSGHPFTTWCNNIYNMFAFRYTWLRLHDFSIGSLSVFRDHISPIFQGDDNLYSASPEYRDKFTGEYIAESVAELGLKYTAADKGKVKVGLSDITEVTFLKRSFRMIDYPIRRWVAPIDIETIYNLPLFYRKGSDKLIETLVQDNLENALVELTLHGKEKYMKLAPPIIEDFHKKNI